MSIALPALPPIEPGGKSTRLSQNGRRLSLVQQAIASVTVYPKRSNGLIDILNPERPKLPVDLPPIAGSRVKTPDPVAAHKKNTVVVTDEVPFVEGDNEPNPFSYPKDVEQFISMLDQFKAEDKEKLNMVPTLMKGTKMYRQNQAVLRRVKPFLRPTFHPSLAQDYKQVVWRAKHGLGINHLQKVSRKMHSEYIMQRKEIYYLKRAVRARKMALEMLERSKDFEEACLTKYEWLTDYTREAFETFLKENDEETQKAARKAEQTLKEKLDKQLRVRELSIQINQLKSDIVGTNESLRECKSYMKFLDDIAREIMRVDEEEEHRAQRREAQVREEMVEYFKSGMTLKEAKAAVLQKANAHLEEQVEKQNEDDAINEALGLEADKEGQSASATFIADINRTVRVGIGLPAELTDPPPEPEPKGRKARREWRRKKRMQLLAIPTPAEVVTSLVKRNEKRLNCVTAKHEKITFGLQLEDVGEKEKQQKVQVIDDGKDDADGYNEKALVRSLELVAGTEQTDRKELGNLCFSRPSQLLAIYGDMEEANLSLIQHSQASEELLEKVQGEITKARKQLNQKGKALREEISTMQTNIEMDEQRAKALGMLFEMFTGGNYDVRKQQKLYRILTKHIAKAYQAAVGTVDHHLNPNMMLTSVEKNFEDLMKEISSMPMEIVLQISRELDKERREVERVEAIRRKKAMYDDRKSRSISRAELPIFKKKGRPLLSRSRPPKTVIKLSQAELNKKAEEDEFNYFFGP